MKYSTSWTDKDVEKHWDSVANIYILENNKVKDTHDQRFNESIKWLNVKQNQLILNISSRDAEANDYILDKDSTVNVLNAEISAGLIAEAKTLRPHYCYIKIKTYSELPFVNNKFDSVLSLETLEHVSEPIEFLKELNRITKNKGRLVLSCPPQTSEIPYRIYSFLFGGHGEGPHKFLSSATVKKMLAHTGWNLIHHYGSVLVPVGPSKLKDLGEKIIRKYQNTFISELGIRQFFICNKK